MNEAVHMTDWPQLFLRQSGSLSFCDVPVFSGGVDMAYMRLGDLLVSTGAISREQLEQALELQKGTKQRLGDVLIQNGFITEKSLIYALKIQLGIEFIDLT